jgi:hypothetical protein
LLGWGAGPLAVFVGPNEFGLTRTRANLYFTELGHLILTIL